MQISTRKGCDCAGRIEPALKMIKLAGAQGGGTRFYITFWPGIRSGVKPGRSKRGCAQRVFLQIFEGSPGLATSLLVWVQKLAIFVCLGKDFCHKAKDKCLLVDELKREKSS